MVVTTRNVSGLLNFNTMQGGRDGGAILFIFGSGGSCDNLIILKAKKGGEKRECVSFGPECPCSFRIVSLQVAT